MIWNIDEFPWDDFFDGFFRKKYTLLIGAGFSLDSTSADGRHLPGGWELGREMFRDFGLDEDCRDLETDRLYGLIENSTTISGKSRDTWFRERFFDTKPASWVHLLKDVGFEVAWTFNVDDAIEQSLGSSCESRTWKDTNDGFRDGKFLVVHLHGIANRPESIVFSRAEYSDIIRAPRSLSAQFNELISAGPVVVLGASMSNEADLARALKERDDTSSGPYPSIIVRPSEAKSFELREYEQWGFGHLQVSAEEFLRNMMKRLPDQKARFTKDNSGASTVSRTIMKFVQQWRLFGDGFEVPMGGTNVLTGAEPTLNDVRRGMTVDRGLTREIEEALLSNESRVLVSGPPFCGKSTVVIQALDSLARKGWNVFAFREEERIDPGAVISYLADQPNTILYVDHAGLFSADISATLAKANEASIPLKIVCVDRNLLSSRLERWGSFTKVQVPGGVKHTTRIDLYAKMREHGVLNSNWIRRSDAAAEKEIESLGVHDFASLISEFFTGRDLSERVQEDLLKLDVNARSIYFACALLDRPAKGARIGWISSIAAESPKGVLRCIEKNPHLNPLVRDREGILQVTNKKHAELFLERIRAERPSWIFDILISLCRALSPTLNIAAIQSGTPSYRASQVLMDEERVTEWLGRRRALEFYADLEQLFGWNSRYWEQRALCASRAGDSVDALRFVDFAITRHEDAFVYNTAATVRFRIALKNSTADNFWVNVMRAIEDVSAAKKMARDDSEYPFVTFFENMIKSVQRSRLLKAPIPSEVRNLWTAWYVEAGQALAFNDEVGRSKLREFSKRWIDLRL